MLLHHRMDRKDTPENQQGHLPSSFTSPAAFFISSSTTGICNTTQMTQCFLFSAYCSHYLLSSMAATKLLNLCLFWVCFQTVSQEWFRAFSSNANTSAIILAVSSPEQCTSMKLLTRKKKSVTSEANTKKIKHTVGN